MTPPLLRPPQTYPSDVCLICTIPFSSPSSTETPVLFPCGHACAGHECAKLWLQVPPGSPFQKCPLCQSAPYMWLDTTGKFHPDGPAMEMPKHRTWTSGYGFGTIRYDIYPTRRRRNEGAKFVMSKRFFYPVIHTPPDQTKGEVVGFIGEFGPESPAIGAAQFVLSMVLDVLTSSRKSCFERGIPLRKAIKEAEMTAHLSFLQGCAAAAAGGRGDRAMEAALAEYHSAVCTWVRAGCVGKVWRELVMAIKIVVQYNRGLDMSEERRMRASARMVGSAGLGGMTEEEEEEDVRAAEGVVPRLLEQLETMQRDMPKSGASVLDRLDIDALARRDLGCG